MKIKYVDINMPDERIELVKKANQIITAYKNSGYSLTLRQLYYQFVSRDWFPDSWKDKATGSTNNERSYKKLGDIINNARMCGYIDWHAIEDRTRSLTSPSCWESPSSIVAACASQYKIDIWENQPYYVEVFVEKDALEGVIENATKPLRVPFFSCRGFASVTSLWDASQRFIQRTEEGKKTLILHLGDHDPSGIDMTRDLGARLRKFNADVKVKRIALNMNQVEQYTPPPNPAKVTDSRAAGYIERFGEECWELDALEPAVIVDLIREEIKAVIDDDAFQESLDREASERNQLKQVSGNWDSIIDGLPEDDTIDEDLEDENDGI